MAFYSIYHGFYVLCKSPGYIGPLLNAGRKDGRTAAFRNTPPPSSFQSIITHCCHCGACVWLFESLGSYFIHGFYILWKSPGYTEPLLNTGRNEERTAAFRNNPPPSSFQNIITHCCHCGACVWLFESLGSFLIHGFQVLWVPDTLDLCWMQTERMDVWQCSEIPPEGPSPSFQSIITHCCHCGTCVRIF